MSNLICKIPIPCQSEPSPPSDLVDTDVGDRLIETVLYLEQLDPYSRKAIANYVEGKCHLFTIQNHIYCEPQSCETHLQTLTLHPQDATSEVQSAYCIEPNAPAGPSRHQASYNASPTPVPSFDAYLDYSAYNAACDFFQSIKAEIDPLYYGALDYMASQNMLFDDMDHDSSRATCAIKVGLSWLRRDMGQFIDLHLSSWLENGLWPKDPVFERDEPGNLKDLSSDMIYAGLDKDPETQRILQRLSRIRLFLWFEKCRTMFAGRVDGGSSNPDSSAVDYLLRHYHTNWDKMDKNSKDTYRQRFYTERSRGKRWAQMVNYLGAGILITCGKDMDTQLNKSTCSMKMLHVAVNIIINLFPASRQVVQEFSEAAVIFLRKGHFSQESYHKWRASIQNLPLEEGLQTSSESQLQQRLWHNVADLGNVDLTRGELEL